MPDAQNEVQIVQSVVRDVAMVSKAVACTTSRQLVEIVSFHSANEAAIIGFRFPFKLDFSQLTKSIDNNGKENVSQNRQNLNRTRT